MYIAIKCIYSFLLIASLTFILAACSESNAPFEIEASSSENNDKGDSKMNAENKVIDVINHPAFKGFGQFMFPTEKGMPAADMQLDGINPLMPFHTNIKTETTLEVLNYLLDEATGGKTIFYDIYTDGEKQSDHTKVNTGLFFFRGRPDAPFAVVCAGGGFQYVGSVHESFPHALELSKKGYNAFAIQYRVGGAEVACEDLAAAITFIFKNADSLKISTDNYSLWGASAGARMAAYLGSHGPAAYSGDNLPEPAAVIMQYTALSDYTVNDPPTYGMIGENDGIAAPSKMKQRFDSLKAAGVDAEFHVYPNLAHGFGMGIGTSAEGWFDDAVAFWEKSIKRG